MQNSKQLCEVVLVKKIHTAQFTIKILCELLLPGRSGLTGQLLGEAIKTLWDKLDHRKTDDDAAKGHIPPIHPEVGLYPLYVL